MENIEKWKSVLGYANYEISASGKVRNIKKGTLRKTHKDKDGYYNVILFKDGKPYNCKIHRLVAEAFIPNPDNKPCVNHINTIRDDNRVENLEWCTIKENNNNPLTRTHLSKSLEGEKCYWYGKTGCNHNRSKTVIQFDLDGNMLKVWGSGCEVAKEMKLHSDSISRCCIGKLKTTGGYRWEYQDNYLANWWDREIMN